MNFEWLWQMRLELVQTDHHIHVLSISISGRHLSQVKHTNLSFVETSQSTANTLIWGLVLNFKTHKQHRQGCKAGVGKWWGMPPLGVMKPFGRGNEGLWENLIFLEFTLHLRVMSHIHAEQDLVFKNRKFLRRYAAHPVSMIQRSEWPRWRASCQVCV